MAENVMHKIFKVKTDDGYDHISFWTKAEDVYYDDDVSLITKINSLQTYINSNNEQINGLVNEYTAEDGSVLNFDTRDGLFGFYDKNNIFHPF